MNVVWSGEILPVVDGSRGNFAVRWYTYNNNEKRKNISSHSPQYKPILKKMDQRPSFQYRKMHVVNKTKPTCKWFLALVTPTFSCLSCRSCRCRNTYGKSMSVCARGGGGGYGCICMNLNWSDKICTRGDGAQNNDYGNIGNKCRHDDVNGTNPNLMVVALVTLYL